jgi:hypothetical protein
LSRRNRNQAICHGDRPATAPGPATGARVSVVDSGTSSGAVTGGQ